jgi:integrase
MGADESLFATAGNLGRPADFVPSSKWPYLICRLLQLWPSALRDACAPASLGGGHRPDAAAEQGRAVGSHRKATFGRYPNAVRLAGGRSGGAAQPAAAVRGPKHSMTTGKTHTPDREEAKALLVAIDTTNLIGLRDRALIGMLLFTFARIGAVTAMKVGDYYPVG